MVRPPLIVLLSLKHLVLILFFIQLILAESIKGLIESILVNSVEWQLRYLVPVKDFRFLFLHLVLFNHFNITHPEAKKGVELFDVRLILFIINVVIFNHPFSLLQPVVDDNCLFVIVHLEGA